MEDRKDMQTRLVPGVGRLPYPAYRGNEPYLFVSYAHDDKDKVFAEIKRFNEAGFHVWYDEGIAPGNEWTDEIANALEGCSLFVVMITPTSAPRKNVLNEINFALDEDKPFLAIHLEETELKGGLKLRTGSTQAILKYLMTDEEYEFKYIEAFTRFGLKRSEAAAPAANGTPGGTASATGSAGVGNVPSAAATVAASAAAAPAPNAASSVTGSAIVDSSPSTATSVTASAVADTAPSVATSVTASASADPAPKNEEVYDDSPEDTKKRANGDLVRVDGFDIEHGLLRGYFGTEKNIKVPRSARVIGSRSFERCRLFIESVDLNRAGKIIAGPLFGGFRNCPNLKTVKIPETVDEVRPEMFHNCPNLTVYVRKSQCSPDFEERFTGKEIVYIDE